VADLTGKRQKARKAALEELGIVENGKVVTKDPFEFLQVLNSHAAGLSQETRLKDFVAAFGQQGARAAAIFSDPAVMKNIHATAEGLKTAQTPAQLQDALGNSPLVKWNKLEAQLNKDLTELGNTVMPEVLSVIEGITSFFRYLSRIGGGIGKLVYGMTSGDNFKANVDAANKDPVVRELKAMFSGVGTFMNTGNGLSFSENMRNALGGANSSATPNQTIVLKVNGRTLGEVVTSYQVNGMAKMPTSSSSPDGRQSLIPVN